jgi:hypothetical protein
MLAGRYRLESRIALGGMGEVWRAADAVLGRPVAVKLLRAEYAGHPEAMTRFRAEAQRAAALSHPNIAHVYDFGEATPGGAAYLVMELVNGPSLAVLLAAGPLGPALVMDVLAQAAAGLQAAHAAGLVHRDIKPGNLLLSRDGLVKITDFGIAYAAGAAPVTQTGMIVGTPAYLAPERVAGRSAGPPSDLYSLGVAGYECLTGAPPFTGVPAEVAAAHLHRSLPPLPPSVPPGVAAFIAELTAADPAARPASAGAAAARAAQLRDALRGGGMAEMPAAGGAGWRPAATRVDEPAGLEAPAAGPGGTQLLSRPVAAEGGRRPGRNLLLALAGAAVLAGLAGWLLAGTGGGTLAPGQGHTGSPRPTASTPSSRPPRTVSVSGASLAGQPASAVIRQLRRLGLNPRLVWTADGGQQPGTVISVRPDGQLPPGSTVTVYAARRPPAPQNGNGHGHGHGHGHGADGNGGGNGNGNGGD